MSFVAEKHAIIYQKSTLPDDGLSFNHIANRVTLDWWTQYIQNIVSDKQYKLLINMAERVNNCIKVAQKLLIVTLVENQNNVRRILLQMTYRRKSNACTSYIACYVDIAWNERVTFNVEPRLGSCYDAVTIPTLIS